MSDVHAQGSFLEEETCKQALEGPAGSPRCRGARGSRSEKGHGIFGSMRNSVQPQPLPGGWKWTGVWGLEWSGSLQVSGCPGAMGTQGGL